MMPGKSRRSTSFPTLNPSTLGGLMTWVLILSVFVLPWLRFWDGTVVGMIASLILGAATLVVWLVFVVVLAFVLSPLQLKLTHWVAAEHQFEPLDLDFEDVPEPFRAWSKSVEPQMQTLGFENLGHFRLAGSTPHVTTFVTLYENDPARQIAQFFTATAKRGFIRKSETVLAFVTEFIDGTRLVTANNRMLPITPQIRIREGSRSFPEIDDTRRLYAIHNASLAHFASDGIRLDPNVEDPAEYLKNEYRKETAKYVESGYYYLDEWRQVYRLTWKGAILGAWKSLWPVKPIRGWMRRSRAARLLRELGLNS
jgi:hypothetical protein